MHQKCKNKYHSKKSKIFILVVQTHSFTQKVIFPVLKIVPHCVSTRTMWPNTFRTIDLFKVVYIEEYNSVWFPNYTRHTKNVTKTFTTFQNEFIYRKIGEFTCTAENKKNFFKITCKKFDAKGVTPTNRLLKSHGTFENSLLWEWIYKVGPVAILRPIICCHFQPMTIKIIHCIRLLQTFYLFKTI